MRAVFLLIHFFLIVTAYTRAQSTFAEAMQQGNASFEAGRYKEAISKYFAAEAFDPAKKDSVKLKLEKVYNRIEQLRTEAEAAGERATKSDLAAQAALRKANNLLNKYYFYEDRFALAQKDKFYFFDKSGNKVRKLKSWDHAEQFDKFRGFASVKTWDGFKLVDELLDTSGNEFPVVYRVQDIKENTKALDLSGDSMHSFPTEVLDFPQLEVLIFNIGTRRPDDAREYPDINLNFAFDSLPAAITKLKNLKYLFLSDCKISYLPPETGELKNLLGLDLSNNQLKALPPQIGQLKNLSSLNLGDNQFKSLPAEISKLEKLTELFLGNNQLSAVPPFISQLKHLAVLYLDENDLEDLPAEMEELKGTLVKLGLNENPFSHWPGCVEKLKNLKELSLENVQLETFPVGITGLTNLHYLNLGSNILKNIPGSIAALTNLEEIDLSANNINSLPPQFGGLVNLEWLDLSNNKLKALPPGIGKLQNLSVLSLKSNLLSSLPRETGDLNNLTTLNLENNQLHGLPTETEKLKNLEVLALAGNPLPASVLLRLRNKLPGCDISFIEK